MDLKTMRFLECQIKIIIIIKFGTQLEYEVF